MVSCLTRQSLNIPGCQEILSMSPSHGLAICVTQTKMEYTPAIPAFSPLMKFNLSLPSRAATHSLCPHIPAKKKKLAHSINIHIPLESVFPYSSEAGLYSHHTYVHSLVPPGMPGTWLRTLAPYFGKWPCQGSPEVASEAGTLLPFTAGSPRSLFQKIISLFTLQADVSQASGLLSP